MSEMLQHALDYAARGLPVFPCNPSVVRGYSKRPLTDHGFKDASTDPEKIRAWWTKWPDALIGGRLGRDAGIWAIDPDVPKEDGDADGLEAWQQLVAEKGDMPHTHTHSSPSGGLHVLFRWREDRPITNREGSLPAGINVRGEGGYLIFPPSKLHDGRPYQVAEPFDFWTFAEAPDWLFDLIETRPTRKTDVSAYVEPEVGIPAAGGNHDRYVAAAVERECQAVAGAPRGKRNEQLNTSAFNLGTLVGAGVLDAGRATSQLIEAAKSSGLAGDDGSRSVMATIESGLTSGAHRPRKLPEPRQRRAERRSSPESQDSPGIGDNQQILIMEDAAALRFGETYKGKLRYDHDAGSWFEWVGTHWRRNGTGLAFHWARELARDLARDEDHKTRITVGKAAFAGSVERYARADPTFAVQASGWDRDAFLLGTPGGVVDLRTGQVREARSEDGITKLTAIAPAGKPDCPTWLRFLKDSSGADAEMVRFLQQYLGYAMLRFRSNAARASLWLDTVPAVQKRCFPLDRYEDRRQDGYIEFRNGSQIWIGGLDDKDRVEKILGQEYATIFLNEASQIPYTSALVAFTRLAQVVPGLAQKAYVDLNPVEKTHWTNQLFGDKRDPIDKRPLKNPEAYDRAFLNPVDNAANLSREYLDSLASLPARQRRRFYEGAYVEDIEGALWTSTLIEKNRVARGDMPDLKRVVVGVDPATSTGEDANETGIIVAGLGIDDRIYVLADGTGRFSPTKWAEKAISLYTAHNADRVVAETNQGGAMVEATIRAVDPSVSYRGVHASRGKITRAEPVSALYEAGRVLHVGDGFPELEEQMTNYTPGGTSPDRMDALVWCCTDLAVKAQAPVAMTAPFSGRMWCR